LYNFGPWEGIHFKFQSLMYFDSSEKELCTSLDLAQCYSGPVSSSHHADTNQTMTALSPTGSPLRPRFPPPPHVCHSPIPSRVHPVEKPHSISPPLTLALPLTPATLFFNYTPTSTDHAAAPVATGPSPPSTSTGSSPLTVLPSSCEAAGRLGSMSSHADVTLFC
jgi:hypothetical protein